MIRLTGIERVFRVGDEEVHALRGVSLDIAQGEYLSIMGPSGSGKSTLLNILGLLDRPNAGRYELNGHDVTGLADDELARVRREAIWTKAAWWTYKYSLLYLALLFVAMVVDRQFRT